MAGACASACDRHTVLRTVLLLRHSLPAHLPLPPYADTQTAPQPPARFGGRGTLRRKPRLHRRAPAAAIRTGLSQLRDRGGLRRLRLRVLRGSEDDVGTFREPLHHADQGRLALSDIDQNGAQSRHQARPQRLSAIHYARRHAARQRVDNIYGLRLRARAGRAGILVAHAPRPTHIRLPHAHGRVPLGRGVAVGSRGGTPLSRLARQLRLHAQGIRLGTRLRPPQHEHRPQRPVHRTCHALAPRRSHTIAPCRR